MRRQRNGYEYQYVVYSHTAVVLQSDIGLGGFAIDRENAEWNTDNIHLFKYIKHTAAAMAGHTLNRNEQRILLFLPKKTPSPLPPESPPCKPPRALVACILQHDSQLSIPLRADTVGSMDMGKVKQQPTK